MAWRLVLALMAVFASASAAAATASGDRLVVFGDSLSDTGNSAGAPYSNGAVWVEHLAARLGLSAAPALRGGDNYALGGARVDPSSGPSSLRAQADRFLSGTGNKDDRGAVLFVVAGGANDVLAALTTATPQACRAAEAAADALLGILDDLAEAGGRRFLVLNLPNLGRVPAVLRYGADAAEHGRVLAAHFNARFAAGLDLFEQTHRIALVRIDVWRLLEQAVADPAGFGLDGVDLQVPCLEAAGGCLNHNAHLFWDSLHPSAIGHERLGSAAAAALAR